MRRRHAAGLQGGDQADAAHALHVQVGAWVCVGIAVAATPRRSGGMLGTHEEARYGHADAAERGRRQASPSNALAKARVPAAGLGRAPRGPRLG